jgi:Transcription factor WhiB
MTNYTGSTPDTTRATDWRDSAACRKEDPGLFFPKGEGDNWQLAVDEARAVCRRCPSVDLCLQWALEKRIDDGIFGGTTALERRNLLRRRGRGKGRGAKKTEPKQPRKPAGCGTRGGYLKHRREKSAICPPCRQANTDANNRLRRTGTTKAAA